MIAHMLTSMHPTFVCFNEILNPSVSAILDGRILGYDPDVIADISPQLSKYLASERRLARRFDFSGEFVAGLFDSQYSQAVKFVGVKMLYDHLYNISDVLTLLLELAKRRTYFIHTRRRNLLAQYYSLKMAERTGVWLSQFADEYNPPEEDLKIKFGFRIC